MTISADYIAKEVAVERKPAELYHIWYATSDWYYTNGDVSVVYGGNTYVPATIKRNSLEKDTQLNVTSMEIEFSYLNNPVVDYLSYNPIDLVWIEVTRLFRDQAPLEGAAIFLGQIKEVVFQGNVGKAACVGFEYYLTHPLPLYRYQRQCNWTLFSVGKCGVSSAGYSQVVTVTALDTTGMIVTCAAMTQKESNYYRYGELVLNGDRRMITLYSATQMYIRFKMKNLAVGSTPTIYAGCDGNISTCKNKFGNVINFGGHPYIPLKDVIIWGG
jgi:uncharacterized phage protein (TIGR02218 family)